MKLNRYTTKLHDMVSRRGLLALILAALMLTSIAGTTWASALYIISDTDDSAIVLEDSSNVPDLSSHLVNTESGQQGKDIVLTEGQTVTIHYEGATLVTRSQGETISALLDRLHITLGRLDMVGVNVSGSGAVLTVGTEITYYETVEEDVPYTTIRVPNASLMKGTEKVTQEGINGTRTAVYEVVWSYGELLSRQCVEELNCTTVDEIVEYGTSVDTVGLREKITKVSTNADGSGYLTLANGDTVAFSEAKTMTATAYTAGEAGIDNYTATGTQVRHGTVAVDKRVIPLGTRMYIVTESGSYVYGLSAAEDTGVRGNKVDLYMPTYEDCINFGRRTCTVYILED